MENPEDSAFQISSTVRALSSALRGESRSAACSEAPVVGVSSSSVRGGCPWFKESSAKNLRSRDFIAPSAVLNKLFPEGQVNSNNIAVIKKTVTASVPYNTSSHAEQRLRCAPDSKRQLSLHHAKRCRFCVWRSLASGKVCESGRRRCSSQHIVLPYLERQYRQPVTDTQLHVIIIDGLRRYRSVSYSAVLNCARQRRVCVCVCV